MPSAKPKTKPKSNPKTVDAYIAAQPEHAQAVLREVRAAIKKALPKAEEVISYAIPAYRSDGGLGIYFAAWRNHYAV